MVSHARARAPRRGNLLAFKLKFVPPRAMKRRAKNAESRESRCPSQRQAAQPVSGPSHIDDFENSLRD